MESNNNKFLVTLVVVLSILVVCFGGYIFYDKVLLKTSNEIQESQNNNVQSKDSNNTSITENQATNITEENDTFSNATKSGKVRVKGYATVDKIEDEGGELHDYIFFHILDTKSQEFINYVQDLQGNAFARNNAIGLGCFNNNTLSYVNHSDQLGEKSFSLSIEDTNKLINSTSNNPITLDLERLSLKDGRWAPICYSHITYINIVN